MEWIFRLEKGQIFRSFKATPTIFLNLNVWLFKIKTMTLTHSAVDNKMFTIIRDYSRTEYISGLSEISLYHT